MDCSMKNKRTVIFRADAGLDIGYGHFIRSLALADMLKESFECVFVTQTPSNYQKKEISKVCKLIELPSDNRKFKLFLNIIRGNEIVVLDNYFFTADYQKRIKERGCDVVCIDDLHDKHYFADIVINYACDKIGLFSVEPYTQCFLGLEWMLLRNPFLHAQGLNYKKSDTENLVLCFGGADIHNLTDRMIVSFINKYKDIQINAIIGDHYSSTLSEKIKSKVNFYKNIPSEKLISLFKHCTFTVLSASTICLEALACGAKTITGYCNESQKEFYHYLVSQKYVIGLGNWDFFIENDIHSLIKSTKAKPIGLNLKDIPGKYVEMFKEL